MNRIREIREERGLSLAAIAEKVGITVPHLSRLERGLRPLTDTWMKRIAPVLGVTPQDLLPPTQPGAKTVEELEQTRWLELWMRLTVRERRAVLEFINALVADNTNGSE